MRVDGLLRSVEHAQGLPTVVAGNPLCDRDALVESDLVAMRFELHSAVFGMLFDLRTSMVFDDGNVGVLVARGVDRVGFDDEQLPEGPWAAHLVMGSTPGSTGAHFTLELAFVTALLSLRSSDAEFYVGSVAGLPEMQPDFVQQDPESIAAAMPDWDSDFAPLRAARRRAPPRV